jgi:YD repeat-containing protein
MSLPREKKTISHNQAAVWRCLYAIKKIGALNLRPLLIASAYLLATLVFLPLFGVATSSTANAQVSGTNCYNRYTYYWVMSNGVHTSSFWANSGVHCYPTSGGGSGGGTGGGGSSSGDGGGGGSIKTSNNPQTNTTATPDKSKNPCPDAGGVTDPIIPSTGNKIEAITDFATPGEMGLQFTRYYISRTVHGSTVMGGWTDNLDYELHYRCLTGDAASCTTATFMRPDGSFLTFNSSSTAVLGGHVIGPFTEVGGGGHATLTYYNSGDGFPGTYTLVDEDGLVYTYGEDLGQSIGYGLQSIVDVSGVGWKIMHQRGSAVTTVKHTSGQVMTLTTSTNGTLSVLTVTDPAGNDYVYQSTPNWSVSYNLLPSSLGAVMFPGSTPTTVTYKYIDLIAGNDLSGALQEVDYNGVAHDLTTYDSSGRANSGSNADGTQRTSIVYSANTTGPVATITNPLGHVSVYQYNASGELLSITGQASASGLCAASFASNTYDANGNLQSATDNNGNTTQYTYAANGQLLKKVEAAGTPVARTTNFVWDSTPGTDRLLSVTVVGWSQTSYTYNAQNRLSTVSVKNLSTEGTANQTLTTSYGYTLYANGMVQTMTVTHPSPGSSDVDTYQYDALGNLTSVTDGLGHATTYNNFNGLGEPGQVVGPNGDVTDFTYDGRGMVLTKTTHPNGTTAQWAYTYDQFGMVSRVAAPDGEVTTWNRNAAGVLQTTTHNDKDGTSTETFGYDANGDVTSDTVTRNGTVSRANNISYDELGRRYRQLGMHGQSLTYTYDGNNNVQSITNAMGHVASYTYDALNRVSQTTESGGASPAIPSVAPSVSAPTNSNTGSYTVSWTSVTEAATYTLQQQTNGGAWQTVESTASTSWGAIGKSDGTYGYRVQACNISGCGPWSSTVSVVVALTPASAPSLSVPSTNNNGAFVVSWSGVSNATSYTLQESVNGGAWNTVQSTGATSWSAVGKTTATYRYQVQGCSNNGCGPWSAISSVAVTLPPTGVPALSAPGTNYTGSYTVSWTGVTAAASYELDEQINGGAWAIVQNTSATSWGTSSRGSGSYGYRVRACNSGGCAGFSTTSSVTVTLAPGSAPALSVPGSNSSGTYAVSWGGVSGATSYQLQEQINGEAWVLVQNSGATSWSTSGRSTGSYGYRVTACNVAGCGPMSAAKVLAETVPIAINGQTYTGYYAIPVGHYGAAVVGFEIVSGTSWRAFTSFYNNGAGGRHFASATGSIPTSAVTVKYTWTFVGYPSGMADAGGTVSNPASAPVAVSSSPVTMYTTADWPQTSMDRGRTYQLRVDFYNAIGVSISSSTATMTAETTGSP